MDQPAPPPLLDIDYSTLRRIPPLDEVSTSDVRLVQFEDDVPALSSLQTIAEFEAEPQPEPRPPSHTLLGDVLDDHRHYYYSRANLGMLAAGVGLAAVLANTTFDTSLRDHYQANLRDIPTDEVSEAVHTPEVLGNGYFTIPAFAATAVVGSWFDEAPLGQGLNEWGQRSLRTILVGAPPMLAMQVITGASRPGETGEGSQWKLFEDNNGVSGHSFMGAVPFLSAAKMTDDPFWKAAFYAGSTLAGFSRVNDDRHYPSQVMLGWWMAYLAATAVDHTHRNGEYFSVFPLPLADGIGAGIDYRW
ncbi:MAG: phosphatase PAP2 family protein [Planctomycetota bacterium]